MLAMLLATDCFWALVSYVCRLMFCLIASSILLKSWTCLEYLFCSFDCNLSRTVSLASLDYFKLSCIWANFSFFWSQFCSSCITKYFFCDWLSLIEPDPSLSASLVVFWFLFVRFFSTSHIAESLFYKLPHCMQSLWLISGVNMLHC